MYYCLNKGHEQGDENSWLKEKNMKQNQKQAASPCSYLLVKNDFNFYSLLVRYSEYDPVDWCANASTLSQFYINQENFKSARYHLLCAKIIFEKHFANYAETLSEDKKETVEGCEAHINRLCGKYGACILEYSQNHSLLSKVYKALENVENPDDEAIENPEFDTIDVKDKLDEVTDSKITSWDEAKKTFLWAQKHYTSSQNYYSLNERCSDYVEITRDISQLYKHLISFETDNDRACKMHRKRLLKCQFKEFEVLDVFHSSYLNMQDNESVARKK